LINGCQLTAGGCQRWLAIPAKCLYISRMYSIAQASLLSTGILPAGLLLRCGA
jgi:hypothetical protein